jgi:tripartite-type tricarboxylate transporter receptor subunit TctC
MLERRRASSFPNRDSGSYRESISTFMRCTAFIAIVTASPAMAQSSWPTEPIRLIVNFAAGGSTDVIARAMATRLSDALGQQLVVDNRVGVGGNVGLEAAAKAASDGYTLLHSSDGAILVNPFLYKMAVDVERDLDPVAPTAKAAIFFVVRPGLPVKNLAELVAYARANPGKLNYGSAGNGTLQHIAAEMMMRAANIKVTHVPYKGSQQALVDLLGGAIDFTFDLGGAIGHIKSEKVRLLGVPGPSRSPIFPEAPTMAEAGTNVDITWMSGVYAPAGTPKDIVARLNREIGRIMQMPETRATLTNMAAEAVAPMTPQAFAAHQKQARARFGAVVRDAGIKIQ